MLDHSTDYFQLPLDPLPDSYFSVQAALVYLPSVTEAAAQVRGKGAGLLAKEEASDAERIALDGILDTLK